MGFFSAGETKQTVIDGKLCAGGTLSGSGAIGEQEGIRKFPKIQLRPLKTHKVKVPRYLNAGEQFETKLDGKLTLLTIPLGFDHTLMSRITHVDRGDVDQVIASTLPTVPGHDIVLSKPVVYGCVSDADVSIGGLLQEAQDMLASMAIENGCNAVLGMNFSVSGSVDSKAGVVVTAFGTPCVVVASTIAAADDTISSPAVSPSPVSEEETPVEENGEVSKPIDDSEMSEGP